MATSFWSFYWSDSPWQRRQDIDLALEEEQGLEMRVGRLTRQVHELQDTLMALMKVLAEMGQFDPRAVQVRVEAELDARKPPPAPPLPADPHPHKAPPPQFAVRCDRCGNHVSSTHTNITAQGTICDACAATL